MGRSNRGHLIKIERGDHTPRQDLREAIADATGVPRDLFADDDEDEADPMVDILSDLVAQLRRELAKERA